MLFISTNENILNATSRKVESDFGTKLLIIDATGRATEGYIRRIATEIDTAQSDYNHVLAVCTESVRRKLRQVCLYSKYDLCSISTEEELKQLASFD